MLSLIRRLFRRTPPHLVGRVPVDAGVGVARDDYRVGHGPSIRPEVLGVTYDHGPSVRQFAPWPPEEGDWAPEWRQQYEPAPPLPSGARPDWAMRAAERQMSTQEIADQRRAYAERARQQDAAMLAGTRQDQLLAPFMRGDPCDFPEPLPRPSAAENAQRYSKPDWTW